MYTRFTDGLHNTGKCGTDKTGWEKREEISEENFKFARVGLTDLFIYQYRREVTNI